MRKRTADDIAWAKRFEEKPRVQPACSFCGKLSGRVKKMIAGPRVFICDECVELCSQIVAQEVE